jgi:hypothetical protein
MVYSYKNAEYEIEANMTEVPTVFGPLISFVDRDDTVDPELSCLSQMMSPLFFPKHQNTPGPIEFHPRTF